MVLLPARVLPAVMAPVFTSEPSCSSPFSRNLQLSAPLSPAPTLSPPWILSLYLHYATASPCCLCSGIASPIPEHSQVLDARAVLTTPGQASQALAGPSPFLSPRLALHRKAEGSQVQTDGNVGVTPGFLSGWMTLSPHPHSVLWIESWSASPG